MTCDEFRDRWLASEPAEIAVGVIADDGTREHCDSCADCRVWEQRERALDEQLASVIVAIPPPELVARLAQVPRLALAARGVSASAAPVADPLAWGVWIELALLAAVGVAALTLTGFDPFALIVLALARLSDVFQAIPLLFNSPLLSYVEGLTFTTVEAMATLILIALGVLQASPELFGMNQRASAENQ